VLAIPGTRSVEHFDDNLGADAIRLSAADIARLNQLFIPGKVVGDRYPPITQLEIDTENF
jgi:aryl-alcohol dehydrogenase-like predicted oxidoreductase